MRPERRKQRTGNKGKDAMTQGNQTDNKKMGIKEENGNLESSRRGTDRQKIRQAKKNTRLEKGKGKKCSAFQYWEEGKYQHERENSGPSYT